MKLAVDRKYRLLTLQLDLNQCLVCHELLNPCFYNVSEPPELCEIRSWVERQNHIVQGGQILAHPCHWMALRAMADHVTPYLVWHLFLSLTHFVSTDLHYHTSCHNVIFAFCSILLVVTAPSPSGASAVEWKGLGLPSDPSSLPRTLP